MVRIGLVGLGYIGKIHLEVYRHILNAEVVAICTRKETEKMFDGHIYVNYEEFLNREDIDVVDICVPTFLHEEYITMAARSGKHIICEKPLTLTTESAERIVHEVQKANVKLFVGHVLRFWPEYEKIKAYSKHGQLTDIKVINARRLGQLPTWSDWFQHPEKSGGALYDLHIHDIDFIYYLLGEVRSVYAVGNQNKYGAWDHILTTITFKNGAKAFVEASHKMPKGYPFTMSFRAQTSVNALDFQMKAGENIESINNSEFVLYKEEKVFPVRVQGTEAFQNELLYFLNCLENDRENHVIPMKDVLYTLKIMNAIQSSLEAGSKVEIF